MSTTNYFVRAWRSLLHNDTYAERQYLYFVVNAYMLLAVLALGLFGLLNVVEGRVLLGRLELAGGLAVILNFIGLRATRNVVMARTFFLCIIIAMLLVMLLTGGT